MQTPQERGRKAEHLVISYLLKHKHQVKQMPYNSPYDLLVDSKYKVEIKCASPIRKGIERILAWQFNLHRHGKMEVFNKPDFYILRLEGIPYHKAAVYFLIKGDCCKPTIQISYRALISQRWAREAEAFYEFLVRSEIENGPTAQS